RRHTRCYRDWSSDVCSADLQTKALFSPRFRSTELNNQHPPVKARRSHLKGHHRADNRKRNLSIRLRFQLESLYCSLMKQRLHKQIGRASCRERATSTQIAWI